MSDTVAVLCFFFFNDTATTEIYTLSLHDALPIFVNLQPSTFNPARRAHGRIHHPPVATGGRAAVHRQRRHLRADPQGTGRSEEHTSELQSRQYLVCRLLL